MAGTYELKVAKNGEFFFNLLAANGQGILKSEMYKSKSAAMNGIASVQTNCGDDSRYDCRTSGNDKFYFVLKAKNHQVIGQSQMYASQESCAKGIASVKSNGPSTVVKDLTAA
ncbi:MAG: YegP family protein [Halioglobus sp.]|nr:YegP family protein [Halioglobus sp.]